MEQEQERTWLLKKMGKVSKDTVQHVKDVCWMKVEVLQMRGKAALESHEAVSLWNMIQRDHNAINQLINVVWEVKNYIDQLGQTKVLRERLCLMDLWINKLQMRPSMHILEDHLTRLEDRLQDQQEEIAIL